MQPENALNSWRQWHGDLRTRPVILGPLDGGRSNRSFLLDSDGKRMVLRLNGNESLLPGATRNNEIEIWQAASEQGIAPPLLHIDEQNQFLVSTFINNTLPPQPQLSEAFVDQVFGLLIRCHQLDVEAPTINYASHIEQYWQVIENKGRLRNTALNKQREPMHLLLEEIVNSETQTGLCHHDPVVANFVGSLDRLYLIDWEYAAHGLLVMDYAAMSTEWKIDDASVLARSDTEPEVLVMAKVLYGYLCALWEEVQA